MLLPCVSSLASMLFGCQPLICCAQRQALQDAMSGTACPTGGGGGGPTPCKNNGQQCNQDSDWWGGRLLAHLSEPVPPFSPAVYGAAACRMPHPVWSVLYAALSFRMRLRPCTAQQLVHDGPLPHALSCALFCALHAFCPLCGSHTVCHPTPTPAPAAASWAPACPPSSAPRPAVAGQRCAVAARSSPLSRPPPLPAPAVAPRPAWPSPAPRPERPQTAAAPCEAGLGHVPAASSGRPLSHALPSMLATPAPEARVVPGRSF